MWQFACLELVKKIYKIFVHYSTRGSLTLNKSLFSASFRPWKKKRKKSVFTLFALIDLLWSVSRRTWPLVVLTHTQTENRAIHIHIHTAIWTDCADFMCLQFDRLSSELVLDRLVIITDLLTVDTAMIIKSGWKEHRGTVTSGEIFHHLILGLIKTAPTKWDDCC